METIEEFPRIPPRVAENKTDKHRYSVQMFFGKDAQRWCVSTYKNLLEQILLQTN